MWMEKHDCQEDGDMYYWDDEMDGDMYYWDDEEDWTNWEDEKYYEDEYMPEFNSTEDLYDFFISHVNMNCPQHSEAGYEWGEDISDKEVTIEEMMDEGEVWLE